MAKRVDISDLLTPNQAARRKGVSRQRIYTWIKSGHLPVVEIAGLPFVRASELKRLAPPPMGRPKNADDSQV